MPSDPEKTHSNIYTVSACISVYRLFQSQTFVFFLPHTVYIHDYPKSWGEMKFDEINELSSLQLQP